MRLRKLRVLLKILGQQSGDRAVEGEDNRRKVVRLWMMEGLVMSIFRL